MAKLQEMGGYVGSAPACYGSSLDLDPDISQKYKISDIGKGVIIHSSTPKYNIEKKRNSLAIYK